MSYHSEKNLKICLLSIEETQYCADLFGPVTFL